MPPIPPLAYCTNVHPGESWADIRTAVQRHLPAVRAKLDFPQDPFPIGLRLSATAVRELLAHERERRSFAEWIAENCFEVFTMNGFPYGPFHGVRVKENVFLPDWAAPERLEYTRGLFLLLHEWASPERDISVSTLPVSHKSFGREDETFLPALRKMGRFLEQLSQETGRDAHLGFEPEPFGQFDHTADSIRFLHKIFRGQPDAESLARRLGITYDTCHFALQYETPEDSLNRFRAEGIRISKIQASNALSLSPAQPGALDALRAFDEPTYFHQVVVLPLEGAPIVFPDMKPALEWSRTAPHPGREWRCHFHIPIGASPLQPLGDTNTHLLDTIRYQAGHPGFSPHWEAETYTWGVLPDIKKGDPDTMIAAELNWLAARFREAGQTG